MPIFVPLDKSFHDTEGTAEEDSDDSDVSFGFGVPVMSKLVLDDVDSVLVAETLSAGVLTAEVIAVNASLLDCGINAVVDLEPDAEELAT